jgi:hypothetical protein
VTFDRVLATTAEGQVKAWMAGSHVDEAREDRIVAQQIPTARNTRSPPFSPLAMRGAITRADSRNVNPTALSDVSVMLAVAVRLKCERFAELACHKGHVRQAHTRRPYT